MSTPLCVLALGLLLLTTSCQTQTGRQLNWPKGGVADVPERRVAPTAAKRTESGPGFSYASSVPSNTTVIVQDGLRDYGHYPPVDHRGYQPVYGGYPQGYPGSYPTYPPNYPQGNPQRRYGSGHIHYPQGGHGHGQSHSTNRLPPGTNPIISPSTTTRNPRLIMP